MNKWLSLFTVVAFNLLPLKAGFALVLPTWWVSQTVGNATSVILPEGG
ncbi:exported protein of unknown function [Citrobacter amalonaticus]|uniref:Uncharacterized protein n=1 Tax=Citrobacter amalonaticus TaxID=35703 RepID=A0AAX2BNY4_CITAM|nr:exported protein of unknown function [Citrobacter amalonaticus]